MPKCPVPGCGAEAVPDPNHPMQYNCPRCSPDSVEKSTKPSRSEKRAERAAARAAAAEEGKARQSAEGNKKAGGGNTKGLLKKRREHPQE